MVFADSVCCDDLIKPGFITMLSNLYQRLVHSSVSNHISPPAPSPMLVVAALQADLHSESRREAITKLGAIAQSNAPVEARLAAASALSPVIHEQRAYSALLPLLDPVGQSNARLIDYQSRIKVLEILKPVLHVPIVERTFLCLLASPDRNFEVRLPALQALAEQLFRQVEQGREPSRALATLVLYGKDKNKEVEWKRGEIRMQFAAAHSDQYRSLSQNIPYFERTSPPSLNSLLPSLAGKDIFEKALVEHCGDLAQRVGGASFKPRGEILSTLMASRDLAPHEQRRVLDTVQIECEALSSGPRGKDSTEIFQKIVRFLREAKHDPSLTELQALHTTLEKKFPDFDSKAAKVELDAFQQEYEQRAYQKRKIQCSILLSERLPRLAREARLEGAPDLAFLEALQLLESGREFSILKMPHVELLGHVGITLLKRDMPLFFKTLVKGLSSFPQLEPHLKLALDLPIGFYSKHLQGALQAVFQSTEREKTATEQIGHLSAIAKQEQTRAEKRGLTLQWERRAVDVYTVTRATGMPASLLQFVRDIGHSTEPSSVPTSLNDKGSRIISNRELNIIGNSLNLLLTQAKEGRDRILGQLAEQLTEGGIAYLSQALESSSGEEAAWRFSLDVRRHLSRSSLQ